MSRQWHVKSRSGVKGPFSSSQIRDLAERGVLKPSSQLRLGPEGNWVHASQVKGLFAPPSPRAAQHSLTGYSAASSMDAAVNQTPSETDPGGLGDLLSELPDAESPQSPDAARGQVATCPGCGTPMPTEAVLCVQCGLDKRTGAQRVTEIQQEKLKSERGVYGLIELANYSFGSIKELLIVILVAVIGICGILAYVCHADPEFAVGWASVAMVLVEVPATLLILYLCDLAIIWLFVRCCTKPMTEISMVSTTVSGVFVLRLQAGGLGLILSIISCGTLAPLAFIAMIAIQLIYVPMAYAKNLKVNWLAAFCVPFLSGAIATTLMIPVVLVLATLFAGVAATAGS